MCGEGGRCLNTAGGWQCQCGPGFTPTEDGRGCTDTRRGLCYQRSVRGRCEAGGSTPVTMSDCCCTMGQAWGDDCQTCPRRGTPQYRDLCPLGQEIDECKTSKLGKHSAEYTYPVSQCRTSVRMASVSILSARIGASVTEATSRTSPGPPARTSMSAWPCPVPVSTSATTLSAPSGAGVLPGLS